MLISVITPNRNGGAYIDRTLSSIALQKDCDAELIVIDGGSTDNSLDVIRRYKNRIAYWVSEPDKGMYDAINKGMRKARGEILAYLNSDDFYYPGTLAFVTQYFERHPDVSLLYADLNYVDAHDDVIFRQSYHSFRLSRFRAMRYATIGQPAAFWRRSLWEEVGEFDNTMKMAADFDFFIRAGQVGQLTHVPLVLAAFRVHKGSMTSRQKDVSNAEIAVIHRRYLGTQNKWQNWLNHTIGNLQFKAINVFNWPRRLLFRLRKIL